jgi:hypothetical protein
MNVAKIQNDATTKPAAGSIGAASPPFEKFVWGAGVECSFLPHINVDQYEWTQHNRFWRDDLKRAREELGLQHLRYALPWHKLENERTSAASSTGRWPTSASPRCKSSASSR